MPINVLIVLDGGFRFDVPTAGDPNEPTGSNDPRKFATDFTYTVLVDALVTHGMAVTKAHRFYDAHATAGFHPFVFSDATLSQFDVVWMIGLDGRNKDVTSTDPSGQFALSDDELNAIGRFMDNGGGVFATGDHDSIGADMAGRIPRVRAMRAWYGKNDSYPHKPAGVPHNNPRETGDRADTVHKKMPGETPAFDYPEFVNGETYVWFDNQSDHIPQIITPSTSPAHPILRSGNRDITVYPDHMHEGTTLPKENDPANPDTFDYSQTSPFGDTAKPEFRTMAGELPMPEAIATGTGLPQASRFASTGALIGAQGTMPVPVSTLSVYEGRAVGVGRIVTGSTFHHYVDINLTGSTLVGTDATAQSRVGADGVKGAGYAFAGAEATFADIKSVYFNITNWLARPRPAIQLILERSSFSKDEVLAAPSNTFSGVVLVRVDGLKPSQFPGGPITSGLSVAQIRARGPQIAITGATDIHIEAIGVSTDDDFANDRLQTITFAYQVRFSNVNATFNPIATFAHKQVDATLTNPAVFATPLTDRAWLTLIQGANPFMLDLAGDNETTWLSSDIKVFRVRQGTGLPAVPAVSGLPGNPSRADALTFIHNIVSNITHTQFESLTGDQAESTLSSMPLTTGGEKVFNFAVARVRVNNAAADASNVRVFFRMFTTQTTAALTYRESAPGVPIEGYVQTAGANPIALPGKNAGGTEWISFPFFSAPREPTPAAQTDLDNVVTIPAGQVDTFYGVLLDNNLDDPYPGLNSGAPAQPTLRDLLVGEHQCLVAQIEYDGAPIPNGATPWTSDKLSQRNLAVSEVANPGLDASRVALHTFEIAATPAPIADTLRPDELLLDWSEQTPPGTVLRIYIPTWRARDVVELADRLYPRHEIEIIDEHTIEMPGGGTHYVPVPKSLHRQTGVISAEFPLGIRKGQRFDVSVRQITTRHRKANIPPPIVRELAPDEAERMIKALPGAAAEKRDKGAFAIDERTVLLTELSVLDKANGGAVLIEHPDPKVIAAAIADSGAWRETIGAFQLGVPVSTKGAMRLEHMRLLSVMRWRLAHLPRTSRWRKALERYVGLLGDKVQALGGNPWAVPATPDGAIPQLPWVEGDDDSDGGDGTPGSGNPLEELIRKLAYPWGCLLLALLIVVLLWLVFNAI